MSYTTDFDSPSSSKFFSPSSSFGDSDSSLGYSKSSEPDAAGNAELQEFLAAEQQKAQLRAQVQIMTDLCWEKCMGTPSAKMDNKTETCLDNCAQRFVDVTLLVTNRFAQAISRQSGGMH